ncbi:uncharacterized protein TNIN_279161 [Trichonephila inaurata madagascariensis]|uniref:DDE Tnp4 domain-containing protein n=1 Tax=Trichonephila inaurata madagascariensis TaxID=2747483 RepID=A0A8X6YMW5_9ARAC|nr:uncharacterized protein TNIN_279161 [Trichonephila inaurata madagascariensis]
MPSGAICFVSHLHCSRISDNELFLRSKPMDLIEPNDVFMGDKGFLIEEELDKISCTLKRPLFLKDKIQFHASETVSNCKFSIKPVTVETAVSRIKQYKYFESALPYESLHNVGSLFIITCVIFIHL